MFDGTNLTLINDVDQDKSANNLGPVRVPNLQINNLEKQSGTTICPTEKFEWADIRPLLDSHCWGLVCRFILSVSNHGQKMCVCFGYNSQNGFCHFFLHCEFF